jgi:putative endonuclease
LGLNRDQQAAWNALYRRNERFARRAFEHREGANEGFSKQHGLKRLVFVGRYEDILTAIQCEKTMKRWPLAWKIKAIVAQNPDWDDLHARLA